MTVGHSVVICAQIFSTLISISWRELCMAVYCSEKIIMQFTLISFE